MTPPDFVKTYQLRLTAQSGIVLVFDTTADRTVMAPLSCEEAERFASELQRAVVMYKEVSAVSEFIGQAPEEELDSRLIRD